MTSDLETRFQYHPPKPDQVDFYHKFRELSRELAAYLDERAPDCREKSLALTKLEEAVMWGNASVARRT